jgi:hypothetical protein
MTANGDAAPGADQVEDADLYPVPEPSGPRCRMCGQTRYVHALASLDHLADAAELEDSERTAKRSSSGPART